MNTLFAVNFCVVGKSVMKFQVIKQRLSYLTSNDLNLKLEQENLNTIP
jgi:hypothetical protein